MKVRDGRDDKGSAAGRTARSSYQFDQQYLGEKNQPNLEIYRVGLQALRRLRQEWLCPVEIQMSFG